TGGRRFLYQHTGGGQMYARLQTLANRPADESLVPKIVDTIASHPGFGGMVSLWQNREDAELASERSAAARGPRPFELTRDEIYEVDADESGRAAGEEPSV